MPTSKRQRLAAAGRAAEERKEAGTMEMAQREFQLPLSGLYGCFATENEVGAAVEVDGVKDKSRPGERKTTGRQKQQRDINKLKGTPGTTVYATASTVLGAQVATKKFGTQNNYNKTYIRGVVQSSFDGRKQEGHGNTVLKLKVKWYYPGHLGAWLSISVKRMLVSFSRKQIRPRPLAPLRTLLIIGTFTRKDLRYQGGRLWPRRII